MNEQQSPKYMQVKAELMHRILTYAYQSHDQLPSEHALAEQFQVSRQTVRQALGELEREGRVYRLQGKGTFVAEPAQVVVRPETVEGMTIGLITTYISDYIFPLIVRGVESRVRARTARLVLASTDNQKERERESLASMLRQPLQGLIVEPTRSAEGNPNFDYFLALAHRGIPFVMLNERYSDVDAPCLKVDDEAGGFEAATHLLGLGHRRIAGFFKTDDLQGVNRMRGFIRAHRVCGCMPLPDFLVRYATDDMRDKPHKLLKQLLELPSGERPTALVCYNDQLAVQLLDVIRQSGLHVPEELSVVGFDDANLATATEIKLTTLTHPKTAMGEAAVDLLFDVMAGVPASDRLFKPLLVVRPSTAAPPPD